jgi:hypothetical protein
MFLKILFLHCSLLASLISFAETIVVKNQQELATASVFAAVEEDCNQ